MALSADLAETHSSIVFFVEDHAYKLKKPLDLGFLDHRTRSARARSCHREVDLNRRLSPDVYLGVADVWGPATARAYEAMLDRTRIALTMGETVVLDASWVDERWRARAREVAKDAHAQLSELLCQTTETVAAERMELRAARAADPSDATPEIAAVLAKTMAPWIEATVIDTSGDAPLPGPPPSRFWGCRAEPSGHRRCVTPGSLRWGDQGEARTGANSRGRDLGPA